NKAVAEVGTAIADANGQITIGFSNIINDPLVSAIEILSAVSSSGHSHHKKHHHEEHHNKKHHHEKEKVGSKNTTTDSYPVKTLELYNSFSQEAVSHSEGGASRFNRFGFLGASEGKHQPLNNNFSLGTLLGKAHGVKHHSWERDALANSGGGS